jgi:hypothetical protein
MSPATSSKSAAAAAQAHTERNLMVLFAAGCVADSAGKSSAARGADPDADLKASLDCASGRDADCEDDCESAFPEIEAAEALETSRSSPSGSTAAARFPDPESRLSRCNSARISDACW